jgi:hypothetical protein
MTDPVIEMLEKMEKAKLEPSPECNDNQPHEFKTFTHADGREYSSWFYECGKCGEVVEKRTYRKGMNKELWK